MGTAFPRTRPTTAFWSGVCLARPDLYKGFNPWHRILIPSLCAPVMRRVH